MEMRRELALESWSTVRGVSGQAVREEGGLGPCLITGHPPSLLAQPGLCFGALWWSLGAAVSEARVALASRGPWKSSSPASVGPSRIPPPSPLWGSLVSQDVALPSCRKPLLLSDQAGMRLIKYPRQAVPHG